MSRFLAEPVELSDGGLRYPEPFNIKRLLGPVLLGLYALLSEYPLLAAPLGLLAVTVLFSRPGLTLARGRIGTANWLGRWWWSQSRRTADVRRIVVRTGETEAEAMLVIDAEKRKPLALKWSASGEFLTRVAESLAGRISGGATPVAVVHERIGFTGERAEQPVLSKVRVREDATGVIFPARVTWRHLVSPEPLTATEPNRGMKVFFGGLSLYIGGMLIVASMAGMSLHLAGHGHQFRVDVGPFVLARPSHADLTIRFAEALVKGVFGLAMGIPMALLGWRLARPSRRFREMIRWFRKRPAITGRGWIELVVNQDGLMIRTRRGRDIARWSRPEMAVIEATRRVVRVTDSEGGESTAILSGLRVQTTEGKEWNCQSESGPTPEDWEWIATRIRVVMEL